MQKLIIDEENKGKRFDVAATELLPFLSRAYVHTLIENKKVLLNGEFEKAGYKLRLGDVISADFDESELEKVADIDLPTLYEDDDVIVVDKPAGVISHSRGRYWNEPSVASFVRQKTGQKGDRSGIVHRLDRATSGVMICAKNQAALSWLQTQFSKRNVKKSYTALVRGHLDPKQAIIDMPVERNPKAPSTFRVGPNGKPAQTKYTVEVSRGNVDTLLLEPLTGRTHQIRVHMSYIKHPIIGDTLYGGPAADRLYLHASKLEITLPGGKRKTFTSQLPEAFVIYGKNP
jgi:23S rRNA pseudouridine1911/1915/1917 synthase